MSQRILGDWGSTNLRLWLVEGDRVVEEKHGPGIAQKGVDREAVLAGLVAPWRAAAGGDLPIDLCGMVGARNGWLEVPYQRCPIDLAGWRAGGGEIASAAGRVRIAAGLSGTNLNGQPDVMRGEETQIFGATLIDPDLGQGNRTLVHPGTHSKWAWLEEGRIARFHTVATGEFFALLREHSALAGLGGGDEGGEGGFDEGLGRARSPGALVAGAFEARTRQLIEGRTRGWALEYLSGLLIGAELHAMAAYSSVSEVTLIGDPILTGRYSRAFDAAGIGWRTLDGEDCAMAGLRAFAAARG